METEKRLIDANELSDAIVGIHKDIKRPGAVELICLLKIAEQPTVDAVEVVHGRWERCGGDLHSSGYAIFCSVCNKVHFVHRKYSLGGLWDKELFEQPKYCPSCGAVMESEE